MDHAITVGDVVKAVATAAGVTVVGTVGCFLILGWRSWRVVRGFERSMDATYDAERN